MTGWLKKAGESGIEVPEWIGRLPVAAESMQQWWRDNLSDPKAATAWLKTVNVENASELFRTLGGQLLHRLFLLFFSLLTLFVLLSNGRSVANRFLETSDRLFGEVGEGLIEKMVDATRGTVNGTVLVAVGEGLWIGVGYLIEGVPNAVLFTIFTTAFAGRRLGPASLSSGFRRNFRRSRCFRSYRFILGPVIMAALLTVWREWVFRPAVEQKAA